MGCILLVIPRSTDDWLLVWLLWTLRCSVLPVLDPDTRTGEEGGLWPNEGQLFDISTSLVVKQITLTATREFLRGKGERIVASFLGVCLVSGEHQRMRETFKTKFWVSEAENCGDLGVSLGYTVRCFSSKWNTDICFLIAVSHFAGLECSGAGVYDKLLDAAAAVPDPTGQGGQPLVFTLGTYLGQLDTFQT